jgi:predicted dehydrogenase
VGAGDIAGKRVASALASARGSRLVAICNRTLDRAQMLAAKFGVNEIYTDFSEALVSSGADAVYIATPLDAHVTQAVAALEAGKHVLVEKPLGRNSLECARAVTKAQKSGLVAGCAYYRRCYPCFQHSQKILDQGEIGTVVHVRMTYHSWFNPGRDDPKRWRVVKAQSGGGPLADMGTHMIDVLIGLLGIPRIVYGRVATLVHPYEVEDSAAFLMGLENGAGVIGSFHWNSKTWSHEFEVVGTDGRLRWSPYDSGNVLMTAGADSIELNLPNAGNVHLPLVEDFILAIREQREPVVSFAEAAKTNLVLDALYDSAKTGREVRL